MIQQVITMLGCTEEKAIHYLANADGNVLSAIETNLNVPVISGTKHMPKPPIVDDGLSDETREKLNDARKFSTMLNASPRNDLRGSSANQHATEQEREQERPEQEQQVEVPVVAASSAHS